MSFGGFGVSIARVRILRVLDFFFGGVVKNSLGEKKQQQNEGSVITLKLMGSYCGILVYKNGLQVNDNP